jgi:multidrug efflux pump subunit AcrB
MIIVAFILTAILGFLSFTNTGIDLFPEINLPYIVVATVYPGGESPVAVEEKVTLPLEQALATANNVKNITTESYPMISLIIIELKTGTNVDSAIIDVNEKIKTFKTINFGAGLMDTAANATSGGDALGDYSQMTDLLNTILDPVVMTVSPSMLPVMKLSIYQEGKTIGQSSEYLREIAKKLETVEGVSSVDVTGLVESMYFLNVNNGKLLKAVLSQIIDYDALFDGVYDGLLAAIEDVVDGTAEANAAAVLQAAQDALDELITTVKGLNDKLVSVNLNERAAYIANELNGVRASVGVLFGVLANEILPGNADTLETVEAILLAAIDAAETTIIAAAAEIESYKPGITDALDLISAAAEEIRGVVAADIPAIDDSIKESARFLGLYLSRADVRSQNKRYFYNGLEAFLDYAGAQAGDLLSADIVKLALFANNIEMPIGSMGGMIITVGDKVKTAEELYRLPVADVKIADLILPALTGMYTSDLSAANKSAQTLLVFADAALKAAESPGAELSDLTSLITSGLGVSGLTATDILSVLGIRLDGQALDALESVLNAGALGGLSLGGIIEANALAGTVLDEIENVRMKLILDDVCTIAKIDNSSLLHTVLNGSAGVQFNINKNPSVATADVSTGVRAKIDEITAADPTLKYTVLDDQGTYIRLVVNTVLSNLISGGLLAVLVLFLFLKKFGPTIVVGMSIVLSLVLAFVFMGVFKINLNVASMAGLALGVGMLVDNSIIVMENIFSMKLRGKNIFEAAIQGATQVSEAVIASTITTVAVFIPLFFTEGIASDIMRDLALTLSFSIISSMIVAMTFVPMAATTFIKNSDQVSKLQLRAIERFDRFTANVKGRSKWVKTAAAPVVLAGKLLIKETSERDGRTFNIIKKAYVKALNGCLKRKFIPLTIAGVLFLMALGSAFLMEMQVLPDLDMNTVNLSVSLDDEALLDRGIDKNDLLQDLIYIADTEISKYRDSGVVTDSGISSSTGFKIMGSSMSEMSGGMINTDGMFGGTMLGGAASSGDLECALLLSPRKERKKQSAQVVADEITRGILEAQYQKRDGGVASASYKVSELATISASYNSLVEMASFDSDSLQLNVYGANEADIEREAAKITAALRAGGIKGLASVENVMENPTLEYRLIIDKQAANQKTGGYTATALLSLLNRFSSPSADASVSLYDNSGDRYTYDVTIYPATMSVKKWYRTNESKYKYIYEEDVLRQDAQGRDVVVNEYYTYDALGIKWELQKITDASGVRFDYIDETTGKTYGISLRPSSNIIYYSTGYRDPIESANDLLYYQLPYENPVTGETGTIALHEILSDECLEKDGDGNLIGIKKVPAYTKITKDGGKRYGHITIYMTDGASANSVKAAVNKALKSYYESNAMTDGVTYGFSTSTALVDDVFSTLLFVLVIGIIFIYLVMVAQFRSLKDPLIVMVTIPLAFTGSIFLLLVSGMSINLMSIMAFIVLAGVVVNNGIVFIDHVNRLINEGAELKDAILKTAADRLRPILMTAMTTIMSLTIMALDGSEAASILRPLGVASIGGLTYATFLTLIVVPTLIAIFKKHDKNPGKGRFFKRIRLFGDNYEYFNKLEREKKSEI